ncbi:unnamed protein product, partial [Musa hybrid cultivar]
MTLIYLEGSSTALNFPTSHPHHLPSTVMSPKSIQELQLPWPRPQLPSPLPPALQPFNHRLLLH